MKLHKYYFTIQFKQNMNKYAFIFIEHEADLNELLKYKQKYYEITFEKYNEITNGRKWSSYFFESIIDGLKRFDIEEFCI